MKNTFANTLLVLAAVSLAVVVACSNADNGPVSPSPAPVPAADLPSNEEIA